MQLKMPRSHETDSLRNNAAFVGVNVSMKVKYRVESVCHAL
jgi:hypothetical protein